MQETQMTASEQLFTEFRKQNTKRVLIPANRFLDNAKRVAYIPKPDPEFNMVMAVDSYKFSHSFSYSGRILGMSSYIEARTGGQHIIVPFGYQAIINRYLTKRITKKMIEQAAKFCKLHGLVFDRAVWLYIVEKYDGYLPVRIRSVPEGTPVASGNAVVTIMCVDEFVNERIFWLCSFLETFLLRAVWYPSTIATMDRGIKVEMKRYYELSGADMVMLDYAKHCFGGRGVTCHEQAQIGGGAHMVMFKSSDTVEGIEYVNYWYECIMAAMSVFATEHSVACSFGLSNEQEIAYIQHQLDVCRDNNVQIASLVGDSANIMRFTDHICTTFNSQIRAMHEATGFKLVIRPDSGDALEIVPQIIHKMAAAFPTTKTTKGFTKLYGGVGIIQGDGVDHLLIRTLLGNITAMMFSADNVLFGSGGAALQKLDRDTFKWAQKACSALVATDEEDEDGNALTKWIEIVKDPITDPGKKSKGGLLTLARNTVTGEVKTIRIDLPVADEWEDMMVDIYDCGQFFNYSNLEEIRARAAI